MRIILAAGFLFIGSTLLYAQEDKAGCADPADAIRFSNATIAACESQEEMTYKIPTGDETGYRRISDWVNAEGDVERLFYQLSTDYKLSDVYRHYQQQLATNGYEVLAEKLHSQRNVSKKIGGNTWLITYYKANRFAQSPEARIDKGSMSVGATFYMAGTKVTPEGKFHIVIAAKQYDADRHVIIMDAIRPEGTIAQTVQSETGGQVNAFSSRGSESPMAPPVVAAAATGAFSKSLEDEGRAVLYDIKFNFNKYNLKDESAPILDEIGQLLKENPSVKIFVVSHTGATGTWEENLDLSVQRAESIVDYLIEYHKIDPERMVPYGVGSLAPLASPQSDDGRKFNERIEILLQN